jgi:gliding motility-associated-like protein
VPQAFSPNGDDQNDKLYIRGLVSDLKYFRVFDRWGNMVFQTTDASVGWDGIYKGKKMNPAVFVYSAEAVCTNGVKVFKRGNVTLIR